MRTPRVFNPAALERLRAARLGRFLSRAMITMLIVLAAVLAGWVYVGWNAH